jgi:hypothetical protein
MKCEFTLHHLLQMEPTQCSETSALNTQTPGKYPEDNLSLQQHSESLKTGKIYRCFAEKPRLEGHTAYG